MTRLLLATTSPMALRAFFTSQIARLRDAGFEVHTVCSPGPMLDQIRGSLPNPPAAIPMTRGIAPAADLAALIRMARLVRRLKPQIVHAHTPKAGLLAMTAAWLARVPARIYTIHGLPLETRSGWRRKVLALVERFTCSRATDVLCVSRSVRDAALREGICSSARVPGDGGCAGIDLQHFNGAGRGAGECSTILFAGRFVRDKGLGELALAWKKLRAEFPEARLRLCGRFEEHDPLDPAVAAELRRDDRVEWSDGFESDMRGAYENAALLVLPTFREGLPTVALEASAMQRPVVATRVTGCVDAVVEGETGVLVPPGDPESLARAVAELMRDPARRASMGAAGRRFVAERFSFEQVTGLLIEEYRRNLAAAPEPAAKRAADIAAALTGLLLTAPLLLAAALAVRVTMGSPVLFRQARGGLNGRVFLLKKFRTMAGGRITPLGRLLRATSIDELPQLWNILRGEMSLVGPRPLLAEYLERYSEREMRRHAVKPGLTGWAQVNGRNAISWSEKFEYDLYYVGHRSLALDLKILLMTAGRLFNRGDNAMPEFQGHGKEQRT